MNEMVSIFKDSLIIDTSDLIGDIAEAGIDTMLNNEIVRNIPIVKTMASAGRIAYYIRERKLLRNLITFINEINCGNVSKEKLEKYIKELNNRKKAEKELGRFLFLLDQSLDNKKSVLYGKIFKSYINLEINWEEVEEYTEIISRMFIQDLDTLNDIYTKKISEVTNLNNNFKVDRLYTLGIIGFSPKAIYPGGGKKDYIVLNKLGKKFADIIFR